MWAYLLIPILFVAANVPLGSVSRHRNESAVAVDFDSYYVKRGVGNKMRIRVKKHGRAVIASHGKEKLEINNVQIGIDDQKLVSFHLTWPEWGKRRFVARGNDLEEQDFMKKSVIATWQRSPRKILEIAMITDSHDSVKLRQGQEFINSSFGTKEPANRFRLPPVCFLKGSRERHPVRRCRSTGTRRRQRSRA